MKNSVSEHRLGHKKKIIGLAVIVTAVVIISVIAMPNISHIFKGEDKISFQEVEESKIPSEISSEVLPEYKTLERALACVAGNDVYVIVTRGEKPTSGFGVRIEKMMVEDDNDKKNLIVYASFDDPDKETPISQIITYPSCVVKTDLSYLPDSIELRIQY
ncbi:MAG: protease complex subunit PrcB family protein [Firmicutes bacterium]|nr:protease complex subunit PrcB family protein [Bacillota bacterium]